MLIALSALVLLALAAPAAQADGTPNITASVSSTSVLYGDDVHVTVSADNPAGSYGYNLSYRVVLPAGVSYSGGAEVAPQQIVDEPASGQTTLIFSNVADVSPNSSHDLGFDVGYDTAIWDAGQRFTVQAQAFVNSDARFVPKFLSNGQPDGGGAQSYTGSTPVVSGDQTLRAIQITQDEPSPEGEILRGVHDDQTVYTITVRDNRLVDTTGVTVAEYLPAGLEFLGCSDATDHTTDAPTNPGSPEEYPGSGAIHVRTDSNCREPASVDTVTVDPDGAGPMPSGVYTLATWNLGRLAATTSQTFTFIAAVPLRANTTTWSGGSRPAGALAQAVNLDNNSGPEVTDETDISSYALATGTYRTNTTTDDNILGRTAEDYAVQKSGDSGTLAENALTKWTLNFETSEYKFVNDATITDTVPSGLCPVTSNQSFTHTPASTDGSDADCAATGDPANDPSAPFLSAVENADGTFTVRWDRTTLARLGHTGVNDRFTVTYWTRTRTHYQSNFENAGPILTRDGITNDVSTAATQFAACTPLVGGIPSDCSNTGDAKIFGTDNAGIQDVSSAGQTAGDPTIDKEIAVPTTNPDCATVSYSNALQHYHPGDTICWSLQVRFPLALDTSPQTISDFLPSTVTFTPGTDTENTLGDNTVGTTFSDTNAANGSLSWTLTGGTTSVPRGSEIFHHVISSVAQPTGTVENGDVLGNLMKFSSVNTPGVSEALRDETDFVLDTPVLGISKGVASIAGDKAPGAGPAQIEAGDDVNYSVTVNNTGPQDASAVQVWDVLPPEYRCIGGIDPTSISDGGTCVTGVTQDHIEWTIPTVAATTGTKTLTYTAIVPSDIGPHRTLTNNVGVRQYEGVENTGGNFDYIPSSNIDPTQTTTNVDPILSNASVHTADAAITKTATTTNLDSATKASIGDTITYTVTGTIPEGTTLAGTPVITDTLATTQPQTYVPGSVTATVNGVAVSPSQIDTTGLAPRLTLSPAPYVNAPGTGDDIVVLTFRTTVDDNAANVAGRSARDTAGFTWTDPTDGPESATPASVSVPLLEPSLTQTKTDDHGGSVRPGDLVTYTVRTANANSANVGTAYNVVETDHVPIGLTPVAAAAGNPPLGDGDVVPAPNGTTTGATWHEGTRTITRTVSSLAPNANDTFQYLATIDNPAIGGSRLTNDLSATSDSINPARGTGRTIGTRYDPNTSDTVQLGGASIVKSVDNATATIGDELTYTLRVTIPADISLFDTAVEDTLPSNLQFDGYGTETCEGGCTLPNAVNHYTAVANIGAGTTKLAWDLGDIAALGAPETIDITYTAHVRDTAGNDGTTKVVAGDRIDNTATVGSDTADNGVPFTATAIPNPASFDNSDTSTQAQTTVVEPHLTLAKDVSTDGGSSYGATTVHAGGRLTYRLTVTNDGGADAHDVTVSDPLPATLTNIAVSGLPAGATPVVTGNTVTVMIPTIGAGQPPATFKIAADLVSTSTMHANQTIDNTGSVDDYYDVAKATFLGTPGRYRSYVGPTAEADVTLASPAFTLVKTTGQSGDPDGGSAAVGQAFPWRVVVKNTTAAPARNVEVTDTLPNNWSYSDDSATVSIDGGTATQLASTGTSARPVFTIPVLQPGSSAEILYRAVPGTDAATDPGLGVGANVNSAEITSAADLTGNTGTLDGAYGAGVSDDARATLGVPHLTITKTPTDTNVTAGDTDNYTIHVANDGTTDATNLDVSDDMPAGMEYTGGDARANPSTGFSETSVAQPGGRGTATTVHWAIDSLPAGDAVDITVPVTIDSDVADATTLTNTAGVSSDELPTPVTTDATVTVNTVADVSILKTGAPTYTPGGTYTWQLEVRNAGPSDAQSVVVDDQLPAGTTFASADTPCAETSTGSNEVRCALGTVPAGFDRTYSVTVNVDPTATTSIDNTATVTSPTDSTPGNNSSDFGPTPAPVADVSVTKTASPSAILNGQSTTFTLTVHNAGPSIAQGVSLVDTLPPELAFVSADDTDCANAAGTITCSIPDMAPNSDRVVHVVTQATSDGVATNGATVSTTTPEPSGGGDPDTARADVSVGPVADLALTKTGPGTVAAGGQLTWELTVTNNGPNNATGVTITDPLPAGTVFASADSGCAASAGTVTCAVGALANGATRTVHVTATVPPALGDLTLTNHASVRGNEGDDHTENNAATAITQVGPAADLAIAKTGPASANADGTVTWTLVASNGGPSVATGVNVADTLPAGATLVSATPTQGTCSANGSALTCGLGSLANGGSAQIQVVAHLDANLAGTTLRNSATIGGDQPDPNTANNGSTATTSVGPPAASDFDLAITKKLAAPAHPALGVPLRYAIVVTNSGPGTASKVKVVDTLPSALQFGSAKVPGGTCSAKGSVVTCTFASLASGASKQIDVTATPLSGGKITNTASVSSSVADRVATNNKASVTTTIAAPPAALRLTKTVGVHGAVHAGQNVRFRITVTNASKKAGAEGVVVCDTLPKGLTYVKFPGAKLRDGHACWNVGLLKPGAKRTFTVTTKVASDARPGIVRNGPAVATSRNTHRATGKAPVRVVVEGASRAGGVTG